MKRALRYIAIVASALLLLSTASAQITNQAVDTGGDVGQYTSIALNASGNPVISYYDVSNGDLKLLICDDPTCSSNTQYVVDDGAGADVGLFSSLVLDASGNPIISYHNETTGALELVVCDDPTCTGGGETFTVVDNTALDTGEYTAIALDSNGNPVISYVDATNNDPRLAICAAPACTTPQLTLLDNSAFDFGLNTGIDITADDIAFVSYHRTNSGQKSPFIASCDLTNCSTPANVTNSAALATGGSAGATNDIALRQTGLPTVIFSQGNDVEIVACNDATCSSSTSGAYSPTTPGPLDLSLTLDANDFPVIALFSRNPNFVNGDLFLLRCNDVGCSGGDDQLTLLDGSLTVTNNIGQFNAIALGPTGEAFVSYYDGNNDDLVLSTQSAECVLSIVYSDTVNNDITEDSAETASITVDCGTTSFTPNVFGIETGLAYGDFNADDANNGADASDLLTTANVPVWTDANFATTGGSNVAVEGDTLDLYFASKQTPSTGLATPGTLASVTFDSLPSIQLSNLEDEEPDALLICETLKLSDEAGSPISALCNYDTVAVQDVLDATIDINTLNIQSDGSMASGNLGFTLSLREEDDSTINATTYDETDSTTGNGSNGAPEVLTSDNAYTNLTDAASPADVLLDGVGHIDCIALEDFALRDLTFENSITGTVTLTAGDATGDFLVNSDDSDDIADDFGGAATTSETDINGDGTVNVLDLVHVGRNFGEGTGSLDACSNSSSVTGDNGP